MNSSCILPSSNTPNWTTYCYYTKSAITLSKEFILKKVNDLINIDIKSLIYDLSSLQQSNPFMITLFIQDYFTTISQVIAKPEYFVKNATLKYTLLAMRKFIKEFAFYSEDELFMSAIGPKIKSKNYLDLRNACHSAYLQSLTP